MIIFFKYSIAKKEKETDTTFKHNVFVKKKKKKQMSWSF